MRRRVGAASRLDRVLRRLTTLVAVPATASVLLFALVALALVACHVASPALAAPQSGRAAALSAQIGELDATLDGVAAKYGVAAQRLVELRESVRMNRRKLSLTRYDLMLAKADLRSRVVAMYKERPVDLLDVVMGSASFEELLGKLTRMRQLGEADARLVDSTERMQQRLQREQGALAESVARLQASLADAAGERSRLEAALAQRRAVLGELRKAAPAKAKELAQPKSTKPSPSTTVAGRGPWWPAIQAAASANGIAARGLYRLMLVESGGVATAHHGSYYGLFQYSTSTWRGAWNPWRGASILDGGAQIKAGARAIRLGLGPRFWPNTYGYAFSD